MKKSELKKMIREEFKKIDEMDVSTIRIPGSLDMYLNKFITALLKSKLTKVQHIAIIYRVLQGLNITPEEYTAMYSKIKSQIKTDEE